MSTPQDDEFIRFAVAGGHLTQEQADEARAALAEIEALGGTASAPDLLQRRGLLDKRQIGRIHEAIASSKTAATVPKQLGAFELLEKLGEGGTGTVFKARQKGLERLVAVRVLAPRLARDQAYLKRFRREARAAARLTHPNVVAALDVGHSDGFYYFAMEYVEGETVAEMLARAGPLGEAQALAIATEVAAALDHAHAKGVLHRDINPRNIMVTHDRQVRVADFGLAKPIGRDAPPGADLDRFLASPAYLAPEELRGESDVDGRADIYSLGVTLYQMLTGDLPFHGPTPVAVAAAAVAEPVPSLRSVLSDARIATARVLARMVAKDRSGRFATPAELHAALRSAASAPRAAKGAPSRRAAGKARAARPPQAPTGRRFERRRKHKMLTYAIAAVAIAVHVAIFAALFPKVLKRWDGREEAHVPAPRPPSTVITPRTSTPPPAPGTSTTAPSPDGQEMVDAVQRALDRAVTFAADHPEAYASRVLRLREAVGEWSGPSQGQLPREGFEVLLALRNELKRAEEALDRAVKAELAKRRTQAEEHFEAGRIAQAVGALQDVPDELTCEASTRRLGQLRRQFHDRAIERFASREEQARTLTRQQRYKEARALYTAAKGWGVPEVTRKAEAQIRNLDQLIAEHGAQTEKAARRAYPTLARQIVTRLAERDYEGARKALDAAIVDPQLAPIRDKLRPFQDLVRAASEVWARVAAGVRQVEAGADVRIGGVAGKFARLEGDRIYVRAGPAVAARPLTDLHSAEAVAFATDGFGQVTPPVQLKLGLFLLADQDYGAARSRLQKAKKDGADAGAALDLMGRIAPRPCMTCRGDKAIGCPDCGGRGYTDVEKRRCEACNARGWFHCRKCRGQGRLRCANCGGRGYITGGFRCMQCYGKGYVKCPSCTRGRVKCKRCNGDGIVTDYTVCERCKGKKKVPCPDCGARGYLPPLDLA
ncbi:MAG: protein kinase domain-containing protein, partial [Planctomycetota bacterium]